MPAVKTIPVTIVDTERELKSSVSYLATVPEFAWDHETRSVDFVKDPYGALKRLSMRSDLVSCATPDHCFVYVMGMVTRKSLSEEVVFNALKPVMQDNNLCHLGWNASFDMHAQANYGVWVQNYEDVMVMAWILDENRSCSLKERCVDCGMSLSKFPFKDLWTTRAVLAGKMEQKKRNPYTFEQLEMLENNYVQYSGEDSIATVLLAPLYREMLAKEPSLQKLFKGLRNPAVRTLFNMERRGIPVDRRYIKELYLKAQDDIERLEGEIFQMAGTHFCLSKTKQLSDVLYKKMRLPVYKTTAKGAASTAVDSLDWLGQQGYPIARKIVEHRRASKLCGTYIGPDAAFQADVYRWGHIHPSFSLISTATGRLACQDPNAQNWPKSSKGYNLRRGIVPSCSDYILIGGDYSQIELRVMANNSGDTAMCAVYRKDEGRARALIEGRPLKDENGKALYPKSDIHQETADACGCARDPAKSINFGIIYGIGDERLGITITKANWDNCIEQKIPWDPAVHVIGADQAHDFKVGYYNKYELVKVYQDHIFDLVKQQGYVTTRFGCRRRLPDIYSSDRGLIMQAGRQAVNFTIQGHVGELMLLIMNWMDRSVAPPDHRKDLIDAVTCLHDCKYRLFLQVHDEIVGEGPKKYEKQIKQALIRLFQCPMDCTKSYPFYGYRIPLVFDAKSAPSYDLLK